MDLKTVEMPVYDVPTMSRLESIDWQISALEGQLEMARKDREDIRNNPAPPSRVPKDLDKAISDFIASNRMLKV